jgi:hypothetical protein
MGGGVSRHRTVRGVGGFFSQFHVGHSARRVSIVLVLVLALVLVEVVVVGVVVVVIVAVGATCNVVGGVLSHGLAGTGTRTRTGTMYSARVRHT